VTCKLAVKGKKCYVSRMDGFGNSALLSRLSAGSRVAGECLSHTLDKFVTVYILVLRHKTTPPLSSFFTSPYNITHGIIDSLEIDAG
jgi:hypothetical protein